MPAYANKPRPSATAPEGPVAAMHRSRRIGDRLFSLVCRAAACTVIAIFVALVVVLIWQAWLAIQTIGVSFFTTIKWDPEPTHRKFGALAFIYGTVATATIAMVIAVPLGVGTAAFLSELAPPWLRRTGSFLVEMLAAIPSVVYGFWGLFVLAPWLQRIITLLGGPNQGGVGIMPAGIILAIMIVPYIAAVSFDACQAVPDSQRDGAFALGATRWQTTAGVVLAYARPGIIGGCFLALGRALGETMAVTMLIGNKTDISLSPFAMGNSIPSVIANEFTEATYDLYLSALVELGLVLLLVSIGINSLARSLIWRMGRHGQRAGSLSKLRTYFWPRVLDKNSAREASPPTVDSKASYGTPTQLAAKAANFHSQSERYADGKTEPKLGTRAGTVNQVMTWMLGLCLAATVGFLLFILGYLLFRG
jgi:phosphate transport system permease protein